MNRHFTSEELSDTLSAFTKEHDDHSWRSYKAWRKEGMPSWSTIRNRFGGWRRALEAVGGNPSRPAHSTTDVLEAIREFSLSGRPVTSKEYELWAGENQKPALRTVYRRLGTWSQALSKAGVQKISKAEIIEALLAFSLEEDLLTAQTYIAWAEKRNAPSLEVVRRRFGSFRKALEAAELEADEELSDKALLVETVSDMVSAGYTAKQIIKILHIRSDELRSALKTLEARWAK